ncbi:NUDIX domain-containing protein [Streptomyces sp. NBC_00190]|nr:NUDIX domain-containing protein [Streptomyces sp. NBC_00868]
MAERVRAILLTPDRTLLLLRRTRPDRPVYWVLPGGGVEPGDASREHALRREIREEIAGEADITRLVHTLEGGQEHQFIYLANISTWSFDDRTGPEFTQEGRGEYHLDEIPFTEAALDELSIMPPQLVPVLRKLAAAESARVTERTCQP